jgi:hypothetical protein
MEELRDQNAAIAEQLADLDYSDDPSEGGREDLTEDELDEIEEAEFEDDQPDIFDLIDESIDRWLPDQEAPREVEQREADFEDLRDRYALLQDPQTATRSSSARSAWPSTRIRG